MFWFRRRQRHAWLADNGGLQTERLRIVPIGDDLQADHLAILQDDFAAVHHWPDTYVNAIAKVVAGSGKLGHHITKHTAMILLSHEPNQVVGLVSVSATKALDTGKPSFSIGFHIKDGHRGLGYASETLPTVVDHLERRAYGHVWLACSRDNRAMRGAALNAGFSDLGEASYTHPDESTEQCVWYQALPR